MSPQLFRSITENEALELSKVLWRKGWILLKNFASHELLSQLSKEANKLKKHKSMEAKSIIVDDLENILVMNSLDSKSELIFDIVRNENIMSLAKNLIGKAATPIHSEYFSKPSQFSVETPAHQDQIFYNNHFNDERAITFWLPLSDVSENDGALEYAILDNLTELIPHHKSRTKDFGLEAVDPSNLRFITVPLKKGDCIVHHSYAIHRSKLKTTKKTREAFAFNYRGSSYKQAMANKPSQ